MIYFQILGLEPTSEKQRIKEAYYKKLPLYHPEEDPEGFRKLHEAYKQALAYEEQSETENETDKWIKQVDIVYSDYKGRLDTKEWERLLEAEAAIRLDLAEECEEKLIFYLKDHPYLPHEVYLVLNEHFNWANREEELKRSYSEELIEYICNRVKYPDSFRFYAFHSLDRERNYEQFIYNYFRISGNLQDTTGKTGELIEETEKMNLIHPDFMILQIRYQLLKEDSQKALKILNELMKYDSESQQALYCALETNFRAGNIKRARKYGRKLIRKYKGHVGGNLLLGQCAEQEKDYEKAALYYEAARRLDPYYYEADIPNQRVWKKLLEEYQKKSKKAPNHIEIKIKKLKAETITHDYEAAALTADGIKEEKISKASVRSDYYFYTGKAYAGRLVPERAEIYFDKASQIAERGQGVHEERVIRAEDGLAWQKAGDYKRAVEIYNKTLEKFPDYECLYFRKGACLFQMGDYEGAITECDRALELKEVPNAFYYKGKALYELGRYEEALQACQKALKLYSHEKFYLFKLKLLAAMNRFEEGIELGESLLGSGKRDEVYYYMSVLAFCAGKTEQAICYIKKVSEAGQREKQYLSYKGYLCENTGEMEAAVSVYLKYLELFDDKEEDINMRLGEIYTYLEEWDNANQMFANVLRKRPEHPSVNGKLSELYEHMGKHEIALYYNEKQLYRNPDEYYYLKRGLLLENRNRLAAAEQCYKRSVNYNAKYGNGWYHLGELYFKTGKFEECIICLEKNRELEIPHADAYFYLIKSLINLGRIEEALSVYDEGMKEHPEELEMMDDKLGLCIE